AAVGWMNRKLGRGQGEDEPASACVHRGHAEHVGEERTDLVSLRGEHDRMHPGDHALSLAALMLPGRWPVTSAGPDPSLLRRAAAKEYGQSARTDGQAVSGPLPAWYKEDRT